MPHLRPPKTNVERRARAQAAAWLHQNDIVHRDIKGDNFLQDTRRGRGLVGIGPMPKRCPGSLSWPRSRCKGRRFGWSWGLGSEMGSTRLGKPSSADGSCRPSSAESYVACSDVPPYVTPSGARWPPELHVKGAGPEDGLFAGGLSASCARVRSVRGSQRHIRSSVSHLPERLRDRHRVPS